VNVDLGNSDGATLQKKGKRLLARTVKEGEQELDSYTGQLEVGLEGS